MHCILRDADQFLCSRSLDSSNERMFVAGTRRFHRTDMVILPAPPCLPASVCATTSHRARVHAPGFTRGKRYQSLIKIDH